MRLDRLTSKFQLPFPMPSLLRWVVTTNSSNPSIGERLVNQDGSSIRPLLTPDRAGYQYPALPPRRGWIACRVSGVEETYSSPTASAACSTSATNWPSSARDQFISSELFVLAALDEGDAGRAAACQG